MKVISKNDSAFVSYVCVTLSLVSTPDKLCFESSVNNTQGWFWHGKTWMDLFINAIFMSKLN